MLSKQDLKELVAEYLESELMTITDFNNCNVNYFNMTTEDFRTELKYIDFEDDDYVLITKNGLDGMNYTRLVHLLYDYVQMEYSLEYLMESLKGCRYE